MHKKRPEKGESFLRWVLFKLGEFVQDHRADCDCALLHMLILNIEIKVILKNVRKQLNKWSHEKAAPSKSHLKQKSKVSPIPPPLRRAFKKANPVSYLHERSFGIRGSISLGRRAGELAECLSSNGFHRFPPHKHSQVQVSSPQVVCQAKITQYWETLDGWQSGRETQG